MKIKNICVVTGSRADYNYLKLTMEKIDKSSKLNLVLVVTGMHLLRKHGRTIDLIKKDGFFIKKTISMYKEKDRSNKSLGKAIGKSIIKFTKTFVQLQPDLILILGDRFEPFVATIAASTLKIPIAHIHGGDISGTIDENIRHAITKLAHIHFPASHKSEERIRLCGEEKWRIYMVGSPTIDLIMAEPLLNKKEICTKLDLNDAEKLIICLQHPNIFEAENAGEQIKITLQNLKELNAQVIIIYPNNDMGSDLIIKEIKKVENNPKFKVFKNLERLDYLSLLKNADLLIGNSSGGLIESPIFKIPVINIGTRNEGREAAGNVISVDQNYENVKLAIKEALSPEFKKNCEKVVNPYGDGTASDKIIKVLEDLELNEKILFKKWSYDL